MARHGLEGTVPAQSTLEFKQDPPVPSFLLKDVVAKLAYLDERLAGAAISNKGDLITVSLRTEPEPGLREILADRIRTVVEAMTKGAFEPPLRVIEEHDYGGTYADDPMPELMARREVVQEGPGYFVTGPLLSRVIEHFERRLLGVATTMNASPYRFPALISPEYMEKVQYFKNFPHSLTFATHLRENLPDIQRFSCDAVTTDGRVTIDNSVYAPASALLAPTICHHLYLTLNGSRLGRNGVVATASGHCFRYESYNMVSLERVWNFTMREIIFVGSEPHVRTKLDEARKHIHPILAEFEITHRIMTANDPFFIGTFRDQAAYQAAFELKYEIRAKLPHKGDTVAIGSYNRHGDFFGRTLDIRLEDGSPAHTGCIGIGFERLAYAFVAQHGIDPTKWPPKVREAIG